MDHFGSSLSIGTVPADVDWTDMARPVIEKRMQK